MIRRNSKGNEILFRRVFLWSYTPANATGVLMLFVFSIPIVLLVAGIELAKSVIDSASLSVLQFAIAAVGLLAIQIFASRHS